jgi:translation initiation factor IF-2
MYSALETVYGEDKAKSRDHVRAREEYEERRSTFRSSRNESVTIDSFLDPIDDLQPQDTLKEQKYSSPRAPLRGKPDKKASRTETKKDTENTRRKQKTLPKRKQLSEAEASRRGGIRQGRKDSLSQGKKKTSLRRRMWTTASEAEEDDDEGLKMISEDIEITEPRMRT